MTSSIVQRGESASWIDVIKKTAGQNHETVYHAMAEFARQFPKVHPGKSDATNHTPLMVAAKINPIAAMWLLRKFSQKAGDPLTINAVVTEATSPDTKDSKTQAKQLHALDFLITSAKQHRAKVLAEEAKLSAALPTAAAPTSTDSKTLVIADTKASLEELTREYDQAIAEMVAHVRYMSNDAENLSGHPVVKRIVSQACEDKDGALVQTVYRVHSEEPSEFFDLISVKQFCDLDESIQKDFFVAESNSEAVMHDLLIRSYESDAAKLLQLLGQYCSFLKTRHFDSENERYSLLAAFLYSYNKGNWSKPNAVIFAKKLMLSGVQPYRRSDTKFLISYECVAGLKLYREIVGVTKEPLLLQISAIESYVTGNAEKSLDRNIPMSDLMWALSAKKPEMIKPLMATGSDITQVVTYRFSCGRVAQYNFFDIATGVPDEDIECIRDVLREVKQKGITVTRCRPGNDIIESVLLIDQQPSRKIQVQAQLLIDAYEYAHQPDKEHELQQILFSSELNPGNLMFLDSLLTDNQVWREVREYVDSVSVDAQPDSEPLHESSGIHLQAADAKDEKGAADELEIAADEGEDAGDELEGSENENGDENESGDENENDDVSDENDDDADNENDVSQSSAPSFAEGFGLFASVKVVGTGATGPTTSVAASALTTSTTTPAALSTAAAPK